LDAVHISLFKDSGEYPRSPELSNYVLSENIKGKLKKPLALAYMLYLYELYELYILDQ